MVKEKKMADTIIDFNRGTPGRGGGGDGMEDMFFAILLGMLKDIENSMEFFNDDENVKKQICYKLISQEKLSQFTDIPYRMIHDMALIYISVYTGSFSLGSEVVITKSDMEKFGMTELDLYEKAKNDTPKLFKAVISPLEDIPEFEEEEAKGIEAVYVVTNEYIKHGSTSILYDGLLKEIVDENPGKEYLVNVKLENVCLVFVVDPIYMDSVAKLIKDTMYEIVKEDEYNILSNCVYSISEDGVLNQYEDV